MHGIELVLFWTPDAWNQLITSSAGRATLTLAPNRNIKNGQLNKGSIFKLIKLQIALLLLQAFSSLSNTATATLVEQYFYIFNLMIVFLRRLAE